MAVNSLDLRKHLGSDDHKERLIQAGFRTPTSETMYLFARFACPVIVALFSVIHLFGLNTFDVELPMQIGGVLLAALFGLKLPDIYIKNALIKRQDEIRKAWPDCLDLMLICVEAGMTIEMTFRKVSQEIDIQSKALAEELTYTLAELSHLADRAQAYTNLGERTGLEDVKNVAVSLTQAERVGTPIGQALRTLAQDSRDRRMTAAEKKAASLGPKLTVPMIAFFLPVMLFLLGWPGVIAAMGWK
ncbi:type II secretion system F family protein [Microvirga tunisiensis]|nr:type II secretion system F family protein [Microvirga tunisiensis]